MNEKQEQATYPSVITREITIDILKQKLLLTDELSPYAMDIKLMEDIDCVIELFKKVAKQGGNNAKKRK